MRILLINPPHSAIGSRIPKEHLPPLSLLAIGGPLIDAGHDVQLLDAEPAPVLEDLNAYRIGWELIDHTRYSYWGNRRAVVVQFSRMPTLLQLLWSARILETLAAPRSKGLRGRDS